jgi:hypothetical protein
MLIAFLSIFLIGLVLASVSWIVGELFEFGGDVAEGISGVLGDATEAVEGLGEAPDVGLDLASGVDAYSPSPVSSRVIFSGLTAFGGFGVIGEALGWPLAATLPFALGGFLLASAGMFFGVIVPIARQQGSTRVVRSDYLGMDVQVGVTIPARGVGQVTFADPNSGALVTEAASSADGTVIPGGTIVRVIRVNAGGLIVRMLDQAEGAQS